MNEILHTSTCSKRLVEAETKSQISLAPDLDCPRCRLNIIAPDLLWACKIALLALTHKPINPKDIELIRQTIANAK